MTLLALVVSKTITKNYVDGTALYRPNPGKQKYFNFKLFIGANKDLHSFEEGNLVMFSGKFTYRNDINECPMFVCLFIFKLKEYYNIFCNVINRFFINLSFQ